MVGGDRTVAVEAAVLASVMLFAAVRSVLVDVVEGIPRPT